MHCVKAVPLRTELFSAVPATGSLAAVVHDYNVSRVRDQAELVQGASRSRLVDKAYPAHLSSASSSSQVPGAGLTNLNKLVLLILNVEQSAASLAELLHAGRVVHGQ